MKFKVKVLHNVSQDMFLRYHPDTSKLYHAHTFGVEAPSVERAAERAFELANVDGPDMLSDAARPLYGQQVVRYRERRNRSLSVGDVVIVKTGEPPALAGVLVVGAVGWEGLEFMPAYAKGSNKTLFSLAYCAHSNMRLNQRK